MHVGVLILPLLVPPTASYGVQSFASFTGESVNQGFGIFKAVGTVDEGATFEHAGSLYEYSIEGGPNFAKMSTLCRASRAEGSATTSFQSEAFKTCTDNWRIRAKDFPGQPLKVFLKVEVTGDIGVFIGNPLGGTIFSSASYQAAFRKSTDVVEVSKTGQWQATNAGTNFAGTAPGLLSIGPVAFTENEAVDVVMKTRVASRVSSSDVASPILGYSKSDFSHTIRVVGVEVQDQGGTPINNFTIISLLGIDWTKGSNPAKLQNFALSKSNVKGGTTVSGTVTLDHRAEQGGQTVFMTCPSGKATPPAEVVVPYRSTTATFDIPTLPVGATRKISIIARMGPVSKTRNLTLNP